MLLTVVAGGGCLHKPSSLRLLTRFRYIGIIARRSPGCESRGEDERGLRFRKKSNRGRGGRRILQRWSGPCEGRRVVQVSLHAHAARPEGDQPGRHDSMEGTLALRSNEGHICFCSLSLTIRRRLNSGRVVYRTSPERRTQSSAESSTATALWAIESPATSVMSYR